MGLPRQPRGASSRHPQGHPWAAGHSQDATLILPPQKSTRATSMGSGALPGRNTNPNPPKEHEGAQDAPRRRRSGAAAHQAVVAQRAVGGDAGAQQRRRRVQRQVGRQVQRKPAGGRGGGGRDGWAGGPGRQGVLLASPLSCSGLVVFTYCRLRSAWSSPPPRGSTRALRYRIFACAATHLESTT
jgi:hypothetical protein